MGHSLLTQFEGQEIRAVTLPFVSTLDKAEEAVRRIDSAGAESGQRPIVFSTLVQDDLREVLRGSNALFLDFFEAFVGPMEHELGTRSTHRSGRAHGIADAVHYAARIDATNYALANDDGSQRDYSRADVILVGVSRSGKTPTCLYLAMQYGIFAANYPLTDDDLESNRLPPGLQAHRSKLFGLRIAPSRLQQIRQERRPNSRYSSPQQVQFETRAAIESDCDLRLRVGEVSPYTTLLELTYLFGSEGDETASTAPDMQLRIYHDACLVEAHSWAVTHHHPLLRDWRQLAGQDLDQRWARNVMLNKWLEYCLDRGHCLRAASAEPNCTMSPAT